MENTLVILALSVLSGWLYRRGGSDKTWHGKERDWGCSLCTILALVLLRGWSWWYIPVFGLSWAFISTYWKKGSDCKWYHWALHGFFVGLSTIPCMFLGIELYKIILRAVALAGIMTVISEASESVVVEEWGRGASIIFTLPLLVA